MKSLGRPTGTSKFTTTLSGISNCKSVLLYARLSNDFYAKDTSKKVRAIKRAQGQAGEHLTKPPYGYIVSPTDKKQWIVDEEAAVVVKRIFDLCIAGKGPI